MHIPPEFAVSDPDQLYNFMRCYPLATCVYTTPQGGIDAEQIVLYPCKGADGAVLLRGHLHKAHPICCECTDGDEFLLIFHGPNSYISPSWYPSKHQHGKVVPTWNYAVVHARGKVFFKQEQDWLLQHLHDLVDRHEQDRPHEGKQNHRNESPWSVDHAPADFTAMLVDALVGFEVVLQQVSGKFKLSQNKNTADYEGVLKGLQNSTDQTTANLADFMEKLENTGK